MDVLTDIATEGSTYVATCTFENEAGEAVVPASAVTWRLLDRKGNELATGSETAGLSVDIVLTDSDMEISNINKELHWLTLVVETTYNSTKGTGLSLVDVAKFQCRNIYDTP